MNWPCRAGLRPWRMGHLFPLMIWSSLVQPHPPASLTLLYFFPISRSSSRSPSYSSKSCKKSPGSRSSRPRRSPSYFRYSRSRYSCLLMCYLLSTRGVCCLTLSPCLHHCHAGVSDGQNPMLQLGLPMAFIAHTVSSPCSRAAAPVREGSDCSKERHSTI